MDFVKEFNDAMIQLIPILVRMAFLGIGILLAKVVIPWLREQKVYSTILKFVKAAEKLADSKQIAKEEKYNFVLRHLESIGIEATPTIHLLIESAVEELDLLKDELAEKIFEVNVNGAETEVEEEG